MSNGLNDLAARLGITEEEMRSFLNSDSQGWCPRRSTLVYPRDCLICCDFARNDREHGGCRFIAREERKQELKEMIDYLVSRLRD